MIRHIIFTLAMIFATFNVANTQTVPNKQKSLITKITATWCPNCGGWGWSFFDDIYEDNKDKALIIKANYSGQLQNETAADFASNFNVNYQPYFILGNENQNVTSVNTATKRTEIKNQVDENFNATPIANAGMLVEKNGNTINVTTRTRFFQQTQGEYYLGVYVIENGVINFQQGQGSNAVHKNVLRASMSSSSFGIMIDEGTIPELSEYFHEFSIDIGNWNENNLEIAAILWERVGGSYNFVNVNSTTEISTVGVTDLTEDEIGFNVYPTLTNSDATIELALKNAHSNVQLDLVDTNGRTLSNIYKGRLESGKQTFEVERSLVDAKGLYYITLRSEDAVATKKIIFQ